MNELLNFLKYLFCFKHNYYFSHVEKDYTSYIINNKETMHLYRFRVIFRCENCGRSMEYRKWMRSNACEK